MTARNALYATSNVRCIENCFQMNYSGVYDRKLTNILSNAFEVLSYTIVLKVYISAVV